MSNLRNSTRLLNSSIAAVLGIGLGLGLSGCSATSGGPRTGSLSKMKTYLAVGDKPLPVVSGEPGSSIAAAEPSAVDLPRPRRTANALGQISGRVFDRDGAPVPEARVRLAVSGASGGTITRTTTDRSGGFTLHGLRPGSSYTLIAESEGDDGVVSGRAQAETSDSEVQITLDSAADAPLRAGGPSKVGRVSDRVPAADDVLELEPPAGSIEPAPAQTSASRDAPSRRSGLAAKLNEEDLPPATEAENLDPSAEGSRPARVSASEAWRRHRDDAPRSPRLPENATPDDEGPNPLPPALEPGAADPSASLPPAKAEFAARTRVDRLAPRRAAGAPRAGSSDVATEQAATSVFDESRPRPSQEAFSEPLEQGSKVIAPESFAPITFEQDPFATDRARLNARNESETTSTPGATPPAPAVARAKSDRIQPTSVPTPEPPAPPDAAPRKQTWRELTQSTKDLPPLEGRKSLALASNASKTDRKILQPSFQSTPRRERSTGTPQGSGPLCEYDARLRKIMDFRLPSLDGTSVRLSDIDADLILLDFWGTWCDPCLRSIPHLVDLQTRMGKKIAVVGIACEPDGSPEAVAKVAETAQRLKINYPILLSRNDGKCPVQESLHIQAFPTMILIDRTGQIVWRDQGATPSTLARLDRRILEASPKSGATRRY